MVYTFGDFRLDVHAGELTRAGEPVELAALSWRLIVFLVTNRDRIVTRDELVTEVWQQAVASDAAIARALADLRQVLGDDGQRQNVIRTYSGRGYRFVADVAPAPQQQLGASRIIERNNELGELLLAIPQIRSGRLAASLIEGPPGIGKTALVEELTRLAQDNGISTAIGRSPEWETQPPFWIWRSVIRSLTRVHSSSALDDARHLLGDAATSESRSGRDNVGTTQPGRYVLLDAISSAIRAVTVSKPLLIVLEDANWADESSLKVAEFLLQDLQDTPLWIVVTQRSTMGPQSDALRDLRVSLMRSSGYIGLSRLAGLSHAGVRQLIGDGLPDEIVATIFERSEGNPLFAKEIHTLFRERRDEVRGLPSNITALFDSRINALSKEGRTMLEAAAIVGRELSADLLGGIIEQSGIDIIRAADEGLATGFLERTSGRSWRFTHALVQEALIAGLSDERRRSLHLAAGRQLAHATRSDNSKAQSAAAQHFVAAHPLGDASETVGQLSVVAEIATAAGEQTSALAYLDEALSLAQGHYGIADSEQLPLLLRRMTARMAVHGQGHPLVRSATDEVIELAAQLDDSETTFQVECARSFHHQVRGELDDAVVHAERAREHSASPSLEIDVSLLLGSAHFWAGNWGLAIAELRQVVAESRHDSPRSQLFGRDTGTAARCYLAISQWIRDADGSEASLIDEAVIASRAGNDPHDLAYTLGFAAMYHQLRNAPERCSALSAEIIEIAVRFGFALREGVGRTLHGWASTTRGASGVDEIRSGLSMISASGSANGSAYFTTLLADALIATGSDDAASVAIAEVLDHEDMGAAAWRPELLRLRAKALDSLGDAKAARAQIRLAREAAEQQNAKAFMHRIDNTDDATS